MSKTRLQYRPGPVIQRDKHRPDLSIIKRPTIPANPRPTPLRTNKPPQDAPFKASPAPTPKKPKFKLAREVFVESREFIRRKLPKMPWKIGIFRELLPLALEAGISQKALHIVIGTEARSMIYLRSLAWDGAVRFGIGGVAGDPVTPEDQADARDKIRQLKSKLKGR